MAQGPTTQQELQLKISLEDGASAGIARIKKQILDLTGGTIKPEQLAKHSEDLAHHIKDIGQVIGGGERALISYIAKFGLAGAAFGSMSAMMSTNMHSLKDFSDRIVDLTNRARAIGVDPAVMKNVIDQYKVAGLSADAAERNIAGFAEALGELADVGSGLRMRMIDAAKEFGDEMDAGIQKITSAQSFEEALQQALVMGQKIYQNELERTKGNTEAAARVRNEFLRSLHLGPEAMVLQRIQVTTAEQKKMMEQRAAATAQYSETVTKLKQEWENFVDDIKASVLGENGVIVKGLQKSLEIMKEIHQWWNRTFGAEKGEETKKAGAAGENVPLPTPRPTMAPAMAQLMSAGPEGEPVGEGNIYKITTTKGKFWEDWRKSSNIIDLRQANTSNMTQGRDYIQTIEENTEQVKKMNNNFKLLDTGEVELKGLGSLPGYGGMGAGAGPSAGPNGSDVGPGSGAGATGGPAELQDPNGKTIDKATMLEAERLGRKGDVEGIQRLFAQKGYHASGPWCGWVAAHYINSAGFKPPPGQNIATSYHNWGEKADPNDVNAPDRPFGSMVATYWHGRYMGKQGQILRTGETGGHVMTIVPGTYDEKTHSFMTVDQHGARRRNISDMDIRYAGDAAVQAQRERQGNREVVDKGSGSNTVRTVKVEVNGKLSADVNAPKGTDVRVSGGGAFDKTETNRTMPLGN